MFKKGQSGNPKGRPKAPPDITAARNKTCHQAQRYLHEILGLPMSELLKIAADKNTSTLKLLFTSIAIRAVKESCERRATFLLERAGMVVDRSPLVAMQINTHKEEVAEQLDVIAPEKLATLLMDESNAAGQGRLARIPLGERGTIVEVGQPTANDQNPDPPE